MVEDGDIARDNATASSFLFLKQSRRTRRRKPRNKFSPQNINNTPPENVVLLRRNVAVSFSGFGATVPGSGSGLGRVENEKRVRDLQMERERYLMSMGFGGLCLVRESTNGCGVVCEECSTGRDGAFHWCVYDAVTVGFRSPAGPIARPVKGSG